MKLTDLYIESFKGIKSLELSNLSNINVINGDNGKGKSSVLEAIAFGFTDTLNDRIEEYVYRGDDKFTLRYKWFLQNKVWDYEIVGSGKGTKRNLNIDGEVFKNSDAVKEICKVINPVITLYSSISEQHRSTQLLFEKPTERLEKFKKIFNPDEINVICDNIKQDIDDLKSKIITIEAEIKYLENRTYNFIDEPSLPNIDIEESKKEYERLSEEKNNYELNKRKYEEYLQNLYKYNDAQGQLEQINKEIEEKTIKLNEIQFHPLTENAPDVTSYYSKLNELRNVYNDQRNLVNEGLHKKDRLSKLNAKLSELNIESNKNKPQRLPVCKYNEKNLEDIDSLILLCNTELNNLREKLNLSKVGKCPITNKDCIEVNNVDLTIINSLIKEQEEKLNITIVKKKEIISEINAFNELRNINEIKKSTFNQIVKESENVVKEIESIEFDLKTTDYNIDLSSFVIEINEIQKEIEAQTNIKKQYDEWLEFNNKQALYKQAIEKDIESKKLIIELHLKVQKPIEVIKPQEFDLRFFAKLENDIKTYEKLQTEIEVTQKHNENIRNEKDKDQTKLQSDVNELYNLNTKVRDLDNAKKVIEKDFSAWLISKGTSSLQQRMNRYFLEMYGRYQCSIKQDKRSIDIFYGDNVEEMKSVNMASGYEREALAMAFRKALCTFQSVQTPMVLDEVDAAADEGNSIKMYRSLLSIQDRQYFITTHHVPTREMLTNEYNANLINL